MARAPSLSTSAWCSPRSFTGHLAAHVEQMMPHLVNGVNGKPPQRPLGAVRVGVDDRPVPAGGADPDQVIGEHQRGIAELPRYVLRVLPGIPVEFHPLIPAHGLAFGPVPALGGQQPLTLDQQHVPNMAGIFQR